MRVQRIVALLMGAVGTAAVFLGGCQRDLPADLAERGYPVDIAKIMITKCAVSGCHDSRSAGAAAGLDLSNWDAMMRGDRNGAVVIPYSHEYSTLFLFTNHFEEYGTFAAPTMPLNGEPLSREEVITLRNWIDAGAPDANGNVAFSGTQHRAKYYVTNQGCDVVTVFDQQTGLQMRKISVGAESIVESPHNVKLSPDGQYWYVAFSNGRYLEKHRCSDDALVGRALLASNSNDAYGSWNTLAITPDGQRAYVVDWNPNGRISQVNLNTMTFEQMFQGSGLLIQPHGSAIHPNGDTLYVTCNQGNYIYKFDISFPQFTTSPDKVIIDGAQFPVNTSTENPHDLIFSPDGTKYYVTSQHSNKVRVMDASSGQLLATIPVGVYPQELAISRTQPYLFITCMEDTATFPGNRGSVYVINTNSNTVVATINSGFQPHGIAVDDAKGLCIVANRNVAAGGPAPHHSTNCAGRNGNVVFIRMSDLLLIPGSKIEVAVDPYSIVIRP